MSPDTLRLFSELLGQVSVQAAHPNFEEDVARLITAKRELADALKASGVTAEPS